MSKRAEFTPGPWEWDGPVWDYDSREEAPWLIQSGAGTYIVLYGEIKCGNEQDARLIAAAPLGYDAGVALLDVVEAAIASGDWRVDGACDPTAAIESMKRFIAKATGADHEHI